MRTKWLRLLALLAALALVAAACGSDDEDTEAGAEADSEETAEESDGDAMEDEEDGDAMEDEDGDAMEDEDDGAMMEDGEVPCEDEGVLCVGLVTDVGKIDDKSFNQSAWEGVQQLGDAGAHIDFIETQDSVDYGTNIGTFIDQNYDVIVTVGFALGEATLEAAAANPDTYFVGVDQFQGEAVDNVAGLIFPEDQAGFLAGALAGLMTESGTVAQVLGTDLVPPVVAFKEGFEGGCGLHQPRRRGHLDLPPRRSRRGLHRPDLGCRHRPSGPQQRRRRHLRRRWCRPATVAWPRWPRRVARPSASVSTPTSGRPCPRPSPA